MATTATAVDVVGGVVSPPAVLARVVPATVRLKLQVAVDDT